jgi:hypothetical protein
MSELIKDYERTAAALEGVAFFRNFAKATFNRHVEAVYWKDIEAHQDARKALLITDKDTQISIANKQLLFFFSLQKFSQQVTEHISFAKGTADKDPNMVKLRVQLSPSLLYDKNGVSIGKRYIRVPHIDESKLGNFRDFKMTHGSTTRMYTFADKKYIKVGVVDEAEGDRVINQLLKIVQTEWKVGTSEQHSYTGKMPADIAKPLLQGITSKCHELHVIHPYERPYVVYV